MSFFGYFSYIWSFEILIMFMPMALFGQVMNIFVILLIL